MKLLRRYPAIAWLFVYVGSIFVLNGSQSGDHGRFEAAQLAVGIALIVFALTVATWLAFEPAPGRPRPHGLIWAYVGVLAFYVICAVAALVVVDTATAIATFLAGLIPLTAVGIWMAHARQKSALGFDGEDDRAVDDDDDPVPGVGVDDTRPMGDSPEVHNEISPHDLPKDHPSRRIAEELTQERDGRFTTTPGHRRGAADAPARPDTDLVDEAERRDGARLRP